MVEEKRAAIYARSATLKLIADPKGVRGQVETCVRYCEKHGFTIKPDLIKQEIAGGVSYKERQGLMALLEAAKRGEFDVLVITDLERLSRRPEYLAEIVSELEACQVSVSCVDQILEGIAVKLYVTGRADEILRMQQKSQWN